MKKHEKIILQEIYDEYLTTGNPVDGNIIEHNFYFHDNLYNHGLFCLGIQQLKIEGYIDFFVKNESLSTSTLNYEKIILSKKGEQYVKTSNI